MKNVNRRVAITLLSTLLSAAMMAGCADSGSEQSASNQNEVDDPGQSLTPQSGRANALFYGNTNYQKLGSLTNVRVIVPEAPTTAVVSSDDITASIVRRPLPSTTLIGYNSTDGSYTDLYVDNLYYVKGGEPKVTSMWYGHDMSDHTDYVPTETAHSSATSLTAPSYVEVDYLGTQRILLATDGSGNKVIVCPDAGAGDIAVPFDNKTFLTLAYKNYGDVSHGAIVYDTATYTFQEMIPPTEACSACDDPGTPLTYNNFTGLTLTGGSSYKFLGDIGGTATSALIADGKLYIMDKNTLAITETVVTPTGTAVTFADLLAVTGKSAYKFNGDSIYYIYLGADSKANLYRVNVNSGTLTQLTAGHGTATETPSRVQSFTDDWVIYGNDGLMMAARKSGTTAIPILLAENTRTSGIRYPFNFGIGSHYLYVTYSINTTTGVTAYQACVFDAAGTSTCRDNSFWSNVVAARQGSLNFNSNYPYTPYAYVRVDDTDNFGGGTLKAVDPTKPLDDGFAMGSVPNYNFNTFLHSYYYNHTTIDSDGYIVIYGKRDDTFVGDAFLVNLHKANSVVNLTNESVPGSALVNSGDAHCHGRYCAVCHAFAGGKIYGDEAGTATATGYNLKLEYADNSSTTCRLGKGKGENFSALYSDITGDFTPVIIDATTGAEIKRGAAQGHAGLTYSNCGFCHARPGDTLRYGAPAVINTAP